MTTGVIDTGSNTIDDRVQMKSFVLDYIVVASMPCRADIGEVVSSRASFKLL